MIKIHIDYDMNSGTYALKTNANSKGLLEVLENWLMYIGPALPEKYQTRPIDNKYLVDIHLDLSNDHFSTKHNCDNVGLLCGLVMQVYQEEKGAAKTK